MDDSAQKQTDELCQPYDKDGKWKIEMVVTKIGAAMGNEYAHSFIRVAAPDERSVLEFHGYNRDPKTGQTIGGSGEPDSKLTVAMVPGNWGYFSNLPTKAKAELTSGTYEEIKPQITKLVAASQILNAEEKPYIGWGIFQPGQNCNTVARMLSRYIGHETNPNDLSSAIATGSGRLLRPEALESINTQEGVDLARLDEALKGAAIAKNTAIVMPDLEAMIDPSLNKQCRPASAPSFPIEAPATAYKPDGTIQPGQNSAVIGEPPAEGEMNPMSKIKTPGSGPS